MSKSQSEQPNGPRQKWEPPTVTLVPVEVTATKNIVNPPENEGADSRPS